MRRKKASVEEKKICIGCNQYFPEDHDNSPCERPGKYQGEQCPCVLFLIKGICGDGCSPYNEYHDKVIASLQRLRREEGDE